MKINEIYKNVKLLSINGSNCLFKCFCGKEFIDKIKKIKKLKKPNCGCLKDYVGKIINGNEILILDTGKRDGSDIVSMFKCGKCGKSFECRKSLIKTGQYKGCGCRKIYSGDQRVFNGITEIDATKDIESKSTFLCHCGKIFKSLFCNISSGRIKSCGCKLKKRENILNVKFNRWTVVENIENSKLWKCLCDCGNYSILDSYSLKSGRSKSCGCLHKDLLNKDITNKKFGKLIAECIVGKYNDGSNIWKFNCECGRSIQTSNYKIVKRKDKSCGKCGYYNKVYTNEKCESRNYNLWNKCKNKALKYRGKFCCICGIKKDLVAHHINGYSIDILGRYDYKNIAILCKKHHILYHKIFGRKAYCNDFDIYYHTFNISYNI